MKITSFSSALGATDAARLASCDFVAVHGNCTIARGTMHLDSINGQIHGSTSCLGAMTGGGITDQLAVFGIEDPDGAYGTAACAFEDDVAKAASAATLNALRAADRLGETPDLVWVSSAPGCEEEVLAGIEAVIGPEVPIIGGSAADNSVEGKWFIFDKNAHFSSGVVVSTLFPSRPTSFAYHNGYAPSATCGTATRVRGRSLVEIDGRPAIDVYRDWTGGAVPAAPTADGSRSILSESTLWPLGRKVAELDGVSSYLLAHPAVAHGSGAIDLFATLAEGEELTLMNGTQSGLIERAGRVAALARAAGRMEDKPIAGALMVYCGGCMLSVRDQMDAVVDGVTSALDGAPFLGTFTFGEQGQILGAGNRHGNLMISCIVFG